MSDSSEDEDLSRFKEAVDTSFVKLIDESRGKETKKLESNGSKKSERYLDISNHYNDVRVPDEMQKRIGAKISDIINRNVEFVTLETKAKKRKIKGGVKLFTDSDSFLTCEEAKDTETEIHNKESKKLKNKKRQVDCEDLQDEEEKVKSIAVTGEYIMSKDDEPDILVMCWISPDTYIQQITSITHINKVKSVAVTGEYIMSKEETKSWKSRRKEKLFKYKSSGKSKVLTAIE